MVAGLDHVNLGASEHVAEQAADLVFRSAVRQRGNSVDQVLVVATYLGFSDACVCVSLDDDNEVQLDRKSVV